MIAWLPLAAALASDPPHDTAGGVDCDDCHLLHTSAGGTLGIDDDDAGICLTCHTSGGMAAAKAIPSSSQAIPGSSGTSHRFDSGPAGFATAGGGNSSTGTVDARGEYTGRRTRTTTLTITASGQVGAATFSWTDTESGSGSGTTGALVSIRDGVSAAFSNGTSSPSFVSGDTWAIRSVPDLRNPSIGASDERDMALRLEDQKVVCSTCHDPHSQETAPPDASAPSYGGAGTGEGRHYQRVENGLDQACLVCHEDRDVTGWTGGSHPVGVSIPSGSYQSPPALDLLGGNVSCSTCHEVHGASTSDGNLLRIASDSICSQCHIPGGTSHLDTGTGALWPGGQFGSAYPAVSSGDRGACLNCHRTHGWPDDSSTTADFPTLLVEQYDAYDDHTDPSDDEDLCRTCHDGSPAATDIWTEITQGTNGTNTYHHPVRDSEQTSGRSVECRDCHDAHEATPAEPFQGAGGFDVAGATIARGDPVEEYEVCFKCHGDDYNSARSRTTNKRLDFATTASSHHAVVGAGRNGSDAMADSLRGGLTISSTIRCTDCHNNEATASTVGPVSNYSGSAPLGPHGSTYSFLLRAAYVTTPAATTYAASKYQLCFDCHDSSRLFDITYSNFDEHSKHVVSEDAPCVYCHYNTHSNRASYSNTYYRINGTTYTNGPPSGYKTRNVSFAPGAISGTTYAKPAWGYNTSTRTRYCWLTCHGKDHSPKSYTPPSGQDNDSLTY